MKYLWVGFLNIYVYIKATIETIIEKKTLVEGSRRAISAVTEGHRNALATAVLQIAQIDVPMNSFNNSGRSAGVRVQTEPHSHVAAPLKVATIRMSPSASRTPLTKNLRWNLE